MSSSSGFLPTRTAIAWAYCARATPSAIRLACVFSNWVRAEMTSEGGVVPAPEGYLRAARAACDLSGALLMMTDLAGIDVVLGR